MIHAYQEIYLSKAQAVLGDAFDYAVNVCGIQGNVFIEHFLASTLSKRMENGEPACISGKSGIEILIDIVAEAKGMEIHIEPVVKFTRSREYWIGWAIAYYQWYSNRKYSEIFEVFSYQDFAKMYDTLHEADISKFRDIVDARVKEFYCETNLKRIRQMYGVTQSELAKRAEVSLRSIQMYEQRNKNINKASVETLYRLSKVLGCSVEDLMEK